MSQPLLLRALRVARMILDPAAARAQELTARLPEARALDRLTRTKQHDPQRPITSKLLLAPDPDRKS